MIQLSTVHWEAAMTCVTIWLNGTGHLVPLPRSPERTHCEVREDQCKRGSQYNLPRSGCAGLISVVLPDRRTAANHREDQKEQPCYFQPEYLQHASNAAEGNCTGFVESPYPAVLAALSPRDAKKSPALSTEMAGRHGRPRLHYGVEGLFYQPGFQGNVTQSGSSLGETLQNFHTAVASNLLRWV